MAVAFLGDEIEMCSAWIVLWFYRAISTQFILCFVPKCTRRFYERHETFIIRFLLFNYFTTAVMLYLPVIKLYILSNTCSIVKLASIIYLFLLLNCCFLYNVIIMIHTFFYSLSSSYMTHKSIYREKFWYSLLLKVIVAFCALHIGFRTRHTRPLHNVSIFHS